MSRLPLVIPFLLAACATGRPSIPIPALAPYDAWTFVPVPEARCAPGTPTGMGINPHQGSKRILVYLRGGGICWDRESCVEKGRSSFVLTGYGPREFDEERASSLKKVYFSRTDPRNVFADWNHVYVPYCTGDLHMGARVHDYGGRAVHHVGFSNMEAYLRLLAATFPGAEQVVLTGGSAGGFGSAWNFEQVQRTFARARDGVQMIDDSGPYLPPPYLTGDLQALLDDRFAASANVPSCAACNPRAPGGGFHRIYSHLTRTIPGFRGSLVSSVQDYSIGGRLSEAPGDAALDCPRDASPDDCRYFTEGLNRLADELIALPGPGQMKVFLLPGNGHVWLGAANRVASEGVTLTDFVRKQVTGDPSWQSVRPRSYR